MGGKEGMFEVGSTDVTMTCDTMITCHQQDVAPPGYPENVSLVFLADRSRWGCCGSC